MEWHERYLGASDMYGSSDNLAYLAGLSRALSAPAQPAKTTSAQVTQAEERFDKRLRQLNSILPVVSGRVVPDDDDLIIGGARRLKLAVLFLDICGFSRINSGEDDEQDRVLKLLNLFMAEMLHVVRSYEGVFEKNTGDGLMAYFGEAPQAECTQRAVDAAVTMHCYNDQVISPRLKNHGLPEVRFRVGIETGAVTVANVGVRGDHHSLVAVGNAPNVACKLMKLIPEGGIVLGNFARSLLSDGWKRETVGISPLPGYVITGTQTPYPAWELKYRAPNVVNWLALSLLSGAMGGR
jgi:class 3 adenylate cyclase